MYGWYTFFFFFLRLLNLQESEKTIFKNFYSLSWWIS